MRYGPLPAGMREPCSTPGRLTEMTYTTRTDTPDGQSLTKRALVYLPHGYDDKPECRYPVLYLMHGGGGDENEVFGGFEGATALKNVLDNAIATGHTCPFIVVAPTYMVEGIDAARRSIEVAVRLTHRFPQELVNDLIPAVDAAFRTVPERHARAFSGFSMGGETTWSVAAQALTHVGSIIPLSGDYWAMGLRGGETYPEETVDALLDAIRSQGIPPQECRIMAFTGDQDIAFPALRPMLEALARRNVFSLRETPVDGCLTWCVKPAGQHTYDDCWEYLWLAMPRLFLHS